MSNQTSIEWADSTFNPWMGCTKVSPACDHCYAERDTRRFGRVEWGSGKPRVRTSAANWKLPERWNKAAFVQCPACDWRGDWAEADRRNGCCPACNHLPERFISARRRVFCASLADWLDNEVPIKWLVDLLDLIRRTPNLDWLLLTKRIGNWCKQLQDARQCAPQPVFGMIERWLVGMAPANVWLGSTVINQAEADRDVPKLLQVPASVRFLSIEPMLGPIGLNMVAVPEDQDRLPRYAGGDGSKFNALQLHDDDRFHQPPAKLDWIISGGESGPHARPMHPDWIRSLRDECAAAGVPFLFKQHGEWLATDFCSDDDVMLPSRRTVYVNRDGSYVDGTEGFDFFAGFKETAWVGKKAAGRKLDGREHTEFPVVRP